MRNKRVIEDDFPEEDFDVREDEPGSKGAADDREIEELPPMTSLTIDCTDRRGIHYQGSFVFKVPTMRDEIEIGRRKSQLLPVSVVNDTNAIMLAEMIAYLDVTLQKGSKGERLPKWWKPLEFYDMTPIVALYTEATAYARRFRGEQGPDSHGDAGEAQEKPDAHDRGDVDGDIPPPVERRTLHRTDTSRSASASASRRSVSSGEG